MAIKLNTIDYAKSINVMNTSSTQGIINLFWFNECYKNVHLYQLIATPILSNVNQDN